ncbi:MAG: TetR/AcrR family transcriptional regulator [Rhodobacteraceae bacterium]|nr:TetR/AcrR family transcriptional regulator [Paracoccaceae bacterium]
MIDAEKPRPTKDRLIRSAAELFRTRGYHGVGLNDLLAHAKAPKGSLYHHFPNGKPDLAMAAATWASDGLLRVVAESFAGAPSFSEGATTLCHKLAKLFDMTNQWDGCPISATLFVGPENAEFRKHADHLYAGWLAEVRDHALRFGASEEDALKKSEHLFILIQGGWQLARARSDSNVMRDLPNKL